MPSPIRTLAEFRAVSPGSIVVVGGWVEDVRNLGSLAFVLVRLRDATVQVTTKKKADEALFRRVTDLPRESVVRFAGTVIENPEARHGREMIPSTVEVLASAATPLPLGVVDKVGADFDTRLDNRSIDLRKPAVRAIFLVRSALLAGLRDALGRHGFIEVQTPKLAGAGAEGGATLFETEYFGRKAFLSQSPQLYKQMLMATGFDRVYEIAPAFRAEPSDTVRHLTEFVSFDGEVAWIDNQEDFLRILESLLADGFEFVRNQARDALNILDVDLRIPRLPLPRVSYVEALDILREHGKRVRDGHDLDTEAEKVLGRAMAEKGHELFFLTEYPTAIKPFYVMANQDNPEYSWSFDLEYGGDEMASGGQREHRSAVLIENLKARRLDPADFEFYLSPFRYGMPPHGGWGLGIDRLVQKVVNLPNIREAVLFPRDRSRLVP
ncbi:MAG TPA: aspartate--tRNA(Asn) ligase [Thermoplasmata archaeon]|nr:aspartate--tRNA(Asn) ligase [Thermoplasmata archaeon]